LKILLVRPQPSSETIGLQHVMIVEPLDLEVLATIVEDKYTPVIVDLLIEKRDFIYFVNKEKPDVVCITGYITNIPKIIYYCIQTKNIDSRITTIVGGVHCEVCPDDFNYPSIDFRVVRNATTNFKPLLEFINGQGTFPSGVLRYGQNVTNINLPEFNFYFPITNRKYTKQYRNHYFYIFHNKVALIKTSFGCPFECKFCFCRKITCQLYFERDLESVFEELNTITEKEIYIVDDNFLVNRNRVNAFIQKVKNHNIKKNYLIYGRADFITNNPDVLKNFREVGLKTVIVGLESFKDSDLTRFNKDSNSEIQKRAIKILNELDIDCFATVIAAPDWSKLDFHNTKRQLKSLGIHYLNLQPLTPLPGTDIYVSDRELLFSRQDYEKWDLAHVVIKPTRMSVYQYYKEIMKLYFAITFQPKYLIQYFKKYPLFQLWIMLKGSFKIYCQYKKKLEEAYYA